MIKLGLDFDNTLITYDSLFKKAAVEKNLIPIEFPESKKLIPIFIHSHHIHQHQVNDKFGIKRPIHIKHIVCF